MEAALLPAAVTGKRRGGTEENLAASEVKRQLSLAGQLVAGFLLQNLVRVMSVMFVGHLGVLALSSASVANVTGFSLQCTSGSCSNQPEALSLRYPVSCEPTNSAIAAATQARGKKKTKEKDKCKEKEKPNRKAKKKNVVPRQPCNGHPKQKASSSR
ncbi:hypothetical protein ACP4OV_011079 [Aristida adscensionis]